MSTIRPFSDLTQREQKVELLRWIAVLPAAVLGRLAIQFLFGLILRLVDAGGLFAGAEPAFLYYLLLLVYYCPKEAAFVIAGAKTAPRSRLIITAVLTAAAILMSLIIHILGQNNPGTTNFTHFAAESAGALSGAAYVVFSEAKARRTTGPSEGEV